MDRLDLLRPGDCLLYSGNGLFSRLIRRKTWSNISHCEVYLGQDESFASRDGKGVDIYPLRTVGLVEVLRPITVGGLNLVAGRRYAESVRGDRYDWLAILGFFDTDGKITDRPHAQICSEAVTNFYRACDFEPFRSEIQAVAIAPSTFLYTPSFRAVKG